MAENRRDLFSVPDNTMGAGVNSSGHLVPQAASSSDGVLHSRLQGAGVSPGQVWANALPGKAAPWGLLAKDLWVLLEHVTGDPEPIRTGC